MIDTIDIKYSTRAEAQKVANLENMAHDYGTAIVVKEGNYYVIKII